MWPFRRKDRAAAMLPLDVQWLLVERAALNHARFTSASLGGLAVGSLAALAAALWFQPGPSAHMGRLVVPLLVMLAIGAQGIWWRPARAVRRVREARDSNFTHPPSTWPYRWPKTMGLMAAAILGPAWWYYWKAMGPISATSLMLPFAGFCCAAGSGFFVAGMRLRTGRELLCASCGYPRSTRNPEPTCPECGRQATPWDGCVVGTDQFRPRLIVLGLIVLAAAIGAGAVAVLSL
jgi:hypothetical protein